MPSLEDKAPIQQPSVARITDAQKRRMELNDDSIYRKVISASVSSGRVGSDSMQRLVSTFDPAIYFDINAQGSDPILSHPGLVITADGDASFAGDLSAATGTFSGTVTAAAIIAASSFTAANPVFTGDIVLDPGGTTELELRSNQVRFETQADGLRAWVFYDDVDEELQIDTFGVGHSVIIDSPEIYLGDSGNNDNTFVRGDLDVSLTTTLDGKVTCGGEIEIDGALNHDGSTAGFFGTAPTTKPAIVGALTSVTDPAALNVIASIISALGALGLATDSTT